MCIYIKKNSFFSDLCVECSEKHILVKKYLQIG